MGGPAKVLRPIAVRRRPIAEGAVNACTKVLAPGLVVCARTGLERGMVCVVLWFGACHGEERGKIARKERAIDWEGCRGR